MKSIRFRVIATYLLIIILTILLFGTGVYSFIRDYYMDSIESLLTNGQDICQSIYSQLYYQYEINIEAEKIGERFIPYTNAQVLLLDTEGKVLYDSTDTYYIGKAIIKKDLGNIIAGETVMQRETSILGERTMSVSRSIISNGKTIGILKLTASLEGVYKVMNQILLILAGGGFIIIVIVSFLALIIANTITRPIRKITAHISDIESGNLEQKPGNKINDEFGGITDNLNSLSLQLKSNQTLREQFIESVSHELRTPLTSIKGWIVTLKNSRKSDKAVIEEGLGIIDNETDRLTGLVDELLDFSGDINQISKNSEMDFSELVKYVCKQMKPRASRLGISLDCSTPDMAAKVTGDYDRLKQVIINLIDNALKYSRSRDSVLVKYLPDNGYATLSVKDTGPGFDPDDVTNIFNMKYQGTNAKRGSGMGLAIAKEIIEAHDGTIHISTGPSGTEVVFRIPYNRGK